MFCNGFLSDSVKLLHHQIVVSAVGAFGAPVPPGELDNRFRIFALKDPTKRSEYKI